MGGGADQRGGWGGGGSRRACPRRCASRCLLPPATAQHSSAQRATRGCEGGRKLVSRTQRRVWGSQRQR
eukprot:1912861-Rhodomonas_salina.1